jgi:hypothetical protein
MSADHKGIFGQSNQEYWQSKEKDPNMQKDKYRVCLAQTTSYKDGKEFNIERAGDMIKEAAANGASLIAFPEMYLTGYTACDDRQLLEDLLFAYIHVGVIRNETNHASDEQSSSESLFQDDDETSSRLTEIKEAIAYFIQSYDAVLENVRDKNPTVVRITGAEVKSAAKKMKKAGRSENRTQNSS